jgi:hypothetical protein
VRSWSFRHGALFTCAAAMLAGCSGSQLPGAMPQTSASYKQPSLRGWMSPNRQKTKRLLYISVAVSGTVELVDVYSVPKYTLLGQITDGIDGPDGLAVDAKGNLYVANHLTSQVTVYPPGKTSPSLTLNEPDSPTDVAVGNNGYVYVSDAAGGVDVFPPGATSSNRRLTNPNLTQAGGVAVSSSNNVYADGENPDSFCSYTSSLCNPAVVEFANAKGSGKKLGLTGLGGRLAGVVVDDHKLIVSEFDRGEILSYPLGQTSPSSTISVTNPVRPAINKAENKIYVPENSYTYLGGVDVYDYPSGKFVTNIPAGDTGAALSPAPTP